MSKLDELIQQYCPDGVEFKPLSDIVPAQRGKRVVKNELSTGGEYPVYQNSLTPLGYYDKSNVSAGTTFIIAAGAAGEIGYSFVDFWAADDCYYFDCPEELDNRYLYHTLLSMHSKIKGVVRHGAVPRISREHVDALVIPVPPIMVQKEIVRILDMFTNLQSELEFELEMRKKQYIYYRDKMLEFKKLGE